MADITMCSGEGCPAKGRCYRHTAKVSDLRQSWFAVPPWNPETYSCEHFWQNGEQNGAGVSK
jgi:hypothetical protein